MAAEWRCSNCGAEHGGDVRIAVFHKDRDASNFDIDNLEVLCHACGRAKYPPDNNRVVIPTTQAPLFFGVTDSEIPPE